MHSSLGISDAATQRFETVATGLNLVDVTGKRGAAARFRRTIAVIEVIIDLLTVTMAVAIGYWLYFHLNIGKHIQYPVRALLSVAFAFAIVVVLMLDRVGAYERGNGLLRIRETEQVLRVSIQSILVAFAVSFFSNVLVSRWLLLISGIMVPLALFIEKHVMYLIVRSLHSRGYGIEKVLIYGSGSTGRRVFSALRRSPRLGLEPVAFVDDDAEKTGTEVFEMGYEPRRSATVVSGPPDRQLIAEYGADLVVIAIPLISHEKFMHTIEESLIAGARVSFVPTHFLPSDPLVNYDDIDGILLGSFGRSPQRGWYELAKRIGDVAGAFLLLLLTSPIFLLLTVLIRLGSSGSAFFGQERIGHHGAPFKMYKFRTMYSDAPAYESSPKTPADPRITPLGRFLRRTSLDELPQLFNVLQGSMSLVGPRPEMPFIVEQYNDTHRQRLQVKPGLTGLWQLSGDRAFKIHENIEYDLYYIQRRNFFMDLAILLHTVVFAMRGI
ncbi:MAG: undecaprenyl-phosphate glucose phosphotransferase [Terriglobales bacterium]